MRRLSRARLLTLPGGGCPLTQASDSPEHALQDTASRTVPAATAQSPPKHSRPRLEIPQFEVFLKKVCQIESPGIWGTWNSLSLLASVRLSLFLGHPPLLLPFSLASCDPGAPLGDKDARNNPSLGALGCNSTVSPPLPT